MDRAELLDFYRRRVEVVPCEKKIEEVPVLLSLLPCYCPFCGGELAAVAAIKEGWRIVCNRCGALDVKIHKKRG